MGRDRTTASLKFAKCQAEVAPARWLPGGADGGWQPEHADTTYIRVLLVRYSYPWRCKPPVVAVRALRCRGAPCMQMLNACVCDDRRRRRLRRRRDGGVGAEALGRAERAHAGRIRTRGVYSSYQDPALVQSSCTMLQVPTCR